MFVVHYNNDTGRIAAWGSVDAETSFLENHSIARFQDEQAVDPKFHKIENGKIVDISEGDLPAWNEPLQSEIDAMVQTELAGTDQYMMPDRNVPNRADWVVYRQVLRDLNKGDPKPTVAEMIAAWPLDPTGKDALAMIRARQNKGNQ